MPIISYTPGSKKIKDARMNDGGYYTAKCDVCATEFHARRSTAKYCSEGCCQIAARKRRKENNDNNPK